mgnify:CR=1 FL=1
MKNIVTTTGDDYMVAVYLNILKALNLKSCMSLAILLYNYSLMQNWTLHAYTVIIQKHQTLARIIWKDTYSIVDKMSKINYNESVTIMT